MRYSVDVDRQKTENKSKNASKRSNGGSIKDFIYDLMHKESDIETDDYNEVMIKGIEDDNEFTVELRKTGEIVTTIKLSGYDDNSDSEQSGKGNPSSLSRRNQPDADAMQKDGSNDNGNKSSASGNINNPRSQGATNEEYESTTTQASYDKSNPRHNKSSDNPDQVQQNTGGQNKGDSKVTDRNFQEPDRDAQNYLSDEERGMKPSPTANTMEGEKGKTARNNPK